ncbi:hypothetical protein C5S53_02135 [Methanophagales archaeon]|nr:hypothetical protein C5S53_02135 [Methanophagales archaeon]
MHIVWPILQPIFIQRGIVSAAISEMRAPHRLLLLLVAFLYCEVASYSADFLYPKNKKSISRIITLGGDKTNE